MEDSSFYHFNLPPELIAQQPPAARDGSRLMILDRRSGARRISPFAELENFLPPEALLVFNEVKVTPARLFGRKPKSGGRVQVLLLDLPLPGVGAGPQNLWCMAKPCTRLKLGSELLFEREGVDYGLPGSVLDRGEAGRRLIRFEFPKEPLSVLDDLGHVPLPPYIRRLDEPGDRERYQTVYAKTPGAVAAPTAGLHFTEAMLGSLKARGQETVFLTLKVGLGTFAPLTEEQLATGRLHREFMSVPESVAEAVRRAKAEGRPVVAVGTTSARALEWASAGGEIRAAEGFGDLFIRPGHQFKAVDGLITNFHLPSSSLLMMVSALAGRENILAAYDEAVSLGFKFFSYGEAMFIL